ncbi:cytochrome P450 [Peniophora sp. CONT]|nr:cytochrome P450 [Peniophora sp. CONT]
MNPKQLNMPLLGPALAGLGSFIFVHRHPLRGDTAVAAELSAFVVSYGLLHFLDGASHGAALLAALRLVALQIATLALFTLAYRISPFHPLARFPGPLINKLTSFRMMYIVYTGQRNRYIMDLHKNYGKFVRTSPNTLSINSHAATAPIYASGVPMDKTPAYSMGNLPGEGLFWMQHVKAHNERRRIWAKGFTPDNLERYFSIAERRCDQLMGCIDKRSDADGVVNLQECIMHFGYDVMGDVAFGGSTEFELMRDGDPDNLCEGSQLAVIAFEILGENPALFQALAYLPVADALVRLDARAEANLQVRRRAGAVGDNSDLVSYFLAAASNTQAKGPKLTDDDVRQDTIFTIAAGSDTTAGVLIIALFYLFCNAEACSKLQAELDTAFPDPSEPLSHTIVNELPYLNAVVEEGIRLGVPLPGFPRVVPKQGALIDGEYVPGGTVVGVSIYAQAMSEENFYPHPELFIPERWLPGGLGTDSICRKAAQMAFQFGAFSCLGKPLAMAEIRIAIAKLVLNYDIKFAPDFDPKAFFDGIINIRTTVMTYPLRVQAKRRVRSLI